MQNQTSDIELLFDGLAEPIDLEFDCNSRMLYWTDRGDPSLGNTVNRVPMNGNLKSPVPEILFTHLLERIGITLELKGERMFVTDLDGSIYSAKLNGGDKKALLEAQGNLSGIVELPSKLV